VRQLVLRQALLNRFEILETALDNCLFAVVLGCSDWAQSIANKTIPAILFRMFLPP